MSNVFYPTKYHQLAAANPELLGATASAQVSGATTTSVQVFFGTTPEQVSFQATSPAQAPLERLYDSEPPTPQEAVPLPVNMAQVGETADMTTQETELRIQVSEARTDTKFAELVGKLDVGLAEIKGELRNTNTQLNNVNTATAGIKTTVITTVIVTAIASLGVVIAVLAYGQQWFGIGVTTRDVVHATVTELLQQQGPAGHR